MNLTQEQLKQIIKEELQSVLSEFEGTKRTGRTGEEEAKDFNKDFHFLINSLTFKGMNYFNALQLASGQNLKGSTNTEIKRQQNEVAHNLLMRSKEVINKIKYLGSDHSQGGPLWWDHREFYLKGDKIFTSLQAAVEKNDQGAMGRSKNVLDPENYYEEDRVPYKEQATLALNWLEQLEGEVEKGGATSTDNPRIRESKRKRKRTARRSRK